MAIYSKYFRRNLPGRGTVVTRLEREDRDDGAIELNAIDSADTAKGVVVKVPAAGADEFTYLADIDAGATSLFVTTGFVTTVSRWIPVRVGTVDYGIAVTAAS